MTHFTPKTVTAMIESNRLSPDQLQHARSCDNCNEWLRAFAAVASAEGKKIAFEIPTQAFRLRISDPDTARQHPRPNSN